MDTFISTTKLILILATVILVADANDVICKKKKNTKKTVMIGEEDSYYFRTQAEDMYAPDTSCVVTYQRKEDCPMIKFTCSQFNINNKDFFCEKGDKMIVEEGKKQESYCQTSAPDVTTSSTFLRVSFISDKNREKKALGAVCTVQCTAEPTTTTTTVEPDTTTTILDREIPDLSKGNSLKLINCNNKDLGHLFLDASTVGLGFCMAYDDRFETDSKTSYEISVDLFNYLSENWSNSGPEGSEDGRLGLAFNLLDPNNYEGVYIRMNTTLRCIQRFHVTNGVFKTGVDSNCIGGHPKGRTWFRLKVAVDNQKKEAKVYINGINQKIGNGKNLDSPVRPRGGVIVAQGYKNMAFYKNFKIVKKLNLNPISK